jgi:hypothetical protein
MKYIFIFSLFFICGFSAHKYYHSHCELLLNDKTGNAEAVVEVYWHDLEVSINKQLEKKVKTTDKEFKDHCSVYFKKNLIVMDSTGKEFNQVFVGSEIKGDQLIVYLEYEGLTNLKGCSMINTLLISEFPQQVNQVNLKNQKKKSLVFSARNTNQKLVESK